MTTAKPDAKWCRIADALTTTVTTAPPGTRLPTEAQLAAEHAVNRHTIRRAIDHLVRAGLVRVEQGRGSFVAETLIDYEVQPRTRFNEWIRRHNREPAGEILTLRHHPATPQTAAALAIEPGAPTLILHRLGRADGTPISLAKHHFDPARHPTLEAALRTAPTISAALATAGIADYRRLSTKVTARLPTPSEATLLNLPRTRPLLVCENLNVDATGTVIEFGLALYPSTRVQVVIEP